MSAYGLGFAREPINAKKNLEKIVNDIAAEASTVVAEIKKVIMSYDKDSYRNHVKNIKRINNGDAGGLPDELDDLHVMLGNTKVDVMYHVKTDKILKGVLSEYTANGSRYNDDPTTYLDGLKTIIRAHVLGHYKNLLKILKKIGYYGAYKYSNVKFIQTLIIVYSILSRVLSHIKYAGGIKNAVRRVWYTLKSPSKILANQRNKAAYSLLRKRNFPLTMCLIIVSIADDIVNNNNNVTDKTFNKIIKIAIEKENQLKSSLGRQHDDAYIKMMSRMVKENSNYRACNLQEKDNYIDSTARVIYKDNYTTDIRHLEYLLKEKTLELSQLTKKYTLNDIAHDARLMTKLLFKKAAIEGKIQYINKHLKWYEDMLKAMSSDKMLIISEVNKLIAEVNDHRYKLINIPGIFVSNEAKITIKRLADDTIDNLKKRPSIYISRIYSILNSHYNIYKDSIHGEDSILSKVPKIDSAEEIRKKVIYNMDDYVSGNIITMKDVAGKGRIAHKKLSPTKSPETYIVIGAVVASFIALGLLRDAIIAKDVKSFSKSVASLWRGRWKYLTSSLYRGYYKDLVKKGYYNSRDATIILGIIATLHQHNPNQKIELIINQAIKYKTTLQKNIYTRLHNRKQEIVPLARNYMAIKKKLMVI